MAKLELSNQEIKVYQLLSDGLDNKTIAEILERSIRSIEGTRRMVLIKLQATSGIHAISMLIRRGIIN